MRYFVFLFSVFFFSRYFARRKQGAAESLGYVDSEYAQSSRTHDGLGSHSIHQMLSQRTRIIDLCSIQIFCSSVFDLVPTQRPGGPLSSRAKKWVFMVLTTTTVTPLATTVTAQNYCR
jgi:hypothetical protein